MVFQTGCHFHELLVHFRHIFFQGCDGGRRTDAGHDVLALGVDQVFAEQLLLTGGGVAGEGHAGTGVRASVAEHHHLHVDCSTPAVRDVVHAAIVVGARVVPRAEHGLNGFHQLDLRIGREILTLLLLVVSLEAGGHLLHVVGVEFGIELDALFFLHLVDDLLEILLGKLHDDIGEHLHETAIGVVGETRVAGLLRQTLHHGGVEAEVQDGVHHAGHGRTGAGTHRNEQRVDRIAEFLAGLGLQLGKTRVDLLLDFVADLAAVLIVLGAGFGGNGEAVRHRHAEVGHFREVRALTAEELPHGAVALFEKVDILLTHGVIDLLNY